MTGYKVLDLTRILAGPYCSMILGDLGAEIIKIEHPEHGDDTRSWGPPFINGESVYFFSVNRNKKSVCINMKHKEGSDLLRQLAAKCDILIENFLPRTLHKYELGYQHLKEINPGLIYCSITGYGQTGPWSLRPGYDVITSAVGGMLHITGTEEGDLDCLCDVYFVEPCKVGVAVTDLSTGLYAHGAIMAALLHKHKTGEGQHIDCNLFSTQVATLVHLGANYLNNGIEAKRLGTAHGSIVPYEAFRTADGHLVVGAGNNSQFLNLLQMMGLEQYSEDARFKSNALRVENRSTLLDILRKRFEENTTDEWSSLFEGAGFPFGPINDLSQVFKNPQIKANRLVQKMNHSTAGEIKLPGPAVQYSKSKTILQGAPPTLGQHTDEVLESVLGLDVDYLSWLREDGVIH
ncbi:succinyl-CoA:glutarate CoA-transferase-like [Tubulanus polymorphus]|uniref:succinyl-CoA:glutarate CoA-transferase-like n=1 Tax=Tubulanus polymorphus TaxID=672921 RepID=UPI003DA3DBA3